MYETVKTSSDKRVRNALEAPIRGGLERYSIEPESRFLNLWLGEANFICGRLCTKDDAEIAVIEEFHVAKKLRGYGIGSRLMRAFVAESKELGVEKLVSFSVSNKALRVRHKVFGEDLLQFYDSEREDSPLLPMTLRQAHMTNNRILKLDMTDPDRPDPSGFIGVLVDLSLVDTSKWERPVECKGLKAAG